LLEIAKATVLFPGVKSLFSRKTTLSCRYWLTLSNACSRVLLMYRYKNQNLIDVLVQSNNHIQTINNITLYVIIIIITLNARYLCDIIDETMVTVLVGILARAPDWVVNCHNNG
jgi:hypothetical protein